MSQIIKSIFQFFIDVFATVAQALVIFALLYAFVFQPHQVTGDSMLPNFHNGEYLLTNKLVYRFRPPQRGDVIIFRSPKNKNLDYIKRIIGLPGEKISLKNFHFYIDKNILDETKYLPADLQTLNGIFIKDDDEISIPENQYFVAGDNRPHSSDSREWGLINKSDIVGRAWLRYWPFSKLGLLPVIAW